MPKKRLPLESHGVRSCRILPMNKRRIHEVQRHRVEQRDDPALAVRATLALLRRIRDRRILWRRAPRRRGEFAPSSTAARHFVGPMEEDQCHSTEA
jgi:hypothetical protein